MYELPRSEVQWQKKSNFSSAARTLPRKRRTFYLICAFIILCVWWLHKSFPFHHSTKNSFNTVQSLYNEHTSDEQWHPGVYHGKSSDHDASTPAGQVSENTNLNENSAPNVDRQESLISQKETADEKELAEEKEFVKEKELDPIVDIEQPVNPQLQNPLQNQHVKEENLDDTGETRPKLVPNERGQQPSLQLGQNDEEGDENEITHGKWEQPLHSINKSPDPEDIQEVHNIPVAGKSYSFPSYAAYLALDEKADGLPDLIHIPFEDAVNDVTYEGWEDDWIAHARYDSKIWGKLPEPKIDFVYTWVNGSDEDFANTMRPYELNSSLNDPEGEWIKSHGVNRYRDWDELRYSIRSIEQHAPSFRNNIQILVNAVDKTEVEGVGTFDKQRPLWLKEDDHAIQILSQEEFFGEEEKACLPTFNSLTIENQIFNTPSDTDRLFALSDDMLLGRPHAASDIYSPLFGPTMGFKSNGYNTLQPPSEVDAHRFGEKPYLIYTSWLLNRRFGHRKRKGQVHFGHSLSRSVTREAINTFPRPALRSACQRFRGETGFQLYSWYVTFHYTMERHREALLWSYIMIRSDTNGDGNLGWAERQAVMHDLEQGLEREGQTTFRKRMFYYVGRSLAEAGLEPPKVNIDTLWTSLDGPAMIRDIECYEFDVNQCLAPGFSSPLSDQHYTNPVFSSATIFDRLSRQDTHCGDCLIKLLLNRVVKGLNPMLPKKKTHPEQRKTVVKALKRYQYAIVEPDALFTMVTDAEQVEHTLIERLLTNNARPVGQLCMNDDVTTDDRDELLSLKRTITRLFRGLLPEPSRFER